MEHPGTPVECQNAGIQLTGAENRAGIPYSQKEKDPITETDAFRHHLNRLGYSEPLTKQLPELLKDFLTYANKPLETITAEDIKTYHTYLQERPNKKTPGGLSESYISHHIYALKLYFHWQQESGILETNPMSVLHFPSPKHPPRQILTRTEITILYESCENYKEQALLSLFYGCGLRRSEGVALNLNDLHLRSHMLYVREGKGAKRRAVPVSETVKTDLWNYITKERISRDTTAVITNCHGRRSTGDVLNKMLKRILKRTDIPQGITLHNLRHSIATHLLESGLSVDYVREFLGHANLETTQIYTHINNKQLWNL